MKKTLLFIISLTAALTAGAQDAVRFDDFFDGRTLRLDYVLAGNNRHQNIFFTQAYTEPQWAGRRDRLEETFLRGNGQIVMTDHTTGRTIYANTFSTLFQEWQATEEATLVSKAFEVSFNMPMPRQKADVTIRLTDFHDQVKSQLSHTIDPADIMIRSIGSTTTPYYYIWKGQPDADGQPDIARCIDLAIVAEGYTQQEMGKFWNDSQHVVDALFAHEPFAKLKERFNVVAVAAPSADSGPSIPHDGHWRSTATLTHYDTFYTDRYLMTSRMHRLYDVLAGIPFEHIIVLVNSSTYGGGGIYNQLDVTTSDHPTFQQVLVHEFGHSYAGLGDEYFYDDGYETMYPADTEPWEPNLTTLVDFESKWADMLPEGTPIPTPPADVPHYRRLKNDAERQQLNAATQRVGVFEGGGYQSKGVYRPAQECRMKINEVELFCPVCTRAIERITDFYTGVRK